jgi:predicted AAA+ superfamily ATPase
MKILRSDEITALTRSLKTVPVTALLGPRQCGKTFLANQLKAEHYFDLENPRDLKAFEEPQLLLEGLAGTVVIDEVQRAPELFPVLRYLVDSRPKQRYLLLGSASGVLLRQSSESLAGRIRYHYLGGLMPKDVGAARLQRLWIRGGYPRSFLAVSDQESRDWLDQYVTTFLERDIPQLGITIPSGTLRRFWTMLSHYHGQTINYSEIAASFGISDMTVRKYLDILQSTLMIRVLEPWHTNTSKRLVKRPKIYFRDSGVFHRFLTVENIRQLTGHPKLGASWEGFALEAVIGTLRLMPQETFFWATHAGAELDLLWHTKGKRWGAEFKYSDTPKVTKSMLAAIEDLDLAHLWVVYPGDKTYPLHKKITVLPLHRSEEMKK